MIKVNAAVKSLDGNPGKIIIIKQIFSTTDKALIANHKSKIQILPLIISSQKIIQV